MKVIYTSGRNDVIFMHAFVGDRTVGMHYHPSNRKFYAMGLAILATNELDVSDGGRAGDMLQLYSELTQTQKAIDSFNDSHDTDEVTERYRTRQLAPQEAEDYEAFMSDMNMSCVLGQKFNYVCHSIFDPYLQQMQAVHV